MKSRLRQGTMLRSGAQLTARLTGAPSAVSAPVEPPTYCLGVTVSAKVPSPLFSHVMVPC